MDELHEDDDLRNKSGAIKGASSQTSILHSLISVARSIRALLSLRLAELGLSNGQDEILLALGVGEAADATALAARLDMRDATLARLVDALIAKGLIDRIGEMRDAYRSPLRISAAGLRMQGSVREIWNKIGHDLVGARGGLQLNRLIAELESMDQQMHVRLTKFC
jgi:DNA-binding MarR family transcriptional regulator